jgi:hypothetical protein
VWLTGSLDRASFAAVGSTSQPFGNFTQRLGLPQLTKQHRYQLAPTPETARVPLGLMLPHRSFKLVVWNQLENLAEDAAYSIHGEVSPGR